MKILKENGLEIIGNNHDIEIFYGYELTAKERIDFDWMNEEETDSAPFFRYRGTLYCMNEIMSLNNSVHNNSGQDKESPFYGYDGYLGDSYFSGILIKLSPCGESLKAYRYYQ